jgi:hypothetical protein
VVEEDNGEDMQEEVVDVDNVEADSLEEEGPAATSTPRRGHLPRPLVRSGFDFLIRIQETSNFKKNFNPVLSCAISCKITLCLYYEITSL